MILWRIVSLQIRNIRLDFGTDPDPDNNFSIIERYVVLGISANFADECL